MVHGQTALQGLKFFCLICLIGLLGSCKASGGSDACAGFEDVISCVEIVSITPRDEASGQDTSDVDALQVDCDPDPSVTEVEDFAAHSARIRFSNDFLRGSDDGFDIRLTSFSVTYELTDCPARARGCPPLGGFSTPQTILVPVEGETEVTVPMVPLDVKDEYVAAGGEVGVAAPSYVAHYTFRGETVPFSAGVTIKGDAAFRITNFNNCP